MSAELDGKNLYEIFDANMLRHAGLSGTRWEHLPSEFRKVWIETAKVGRWSRVEYVVQDNGSKVMLE